MMVALCFFGLGLTAGLAACGVWCVGSWWRRRWRKAKEAAGEKLKKVVAGAVVGAAVAGAIGGGWRALTLAPPLGVVESSRAGPAVPSPGTEPATRSDGTNGTAGRGFVGPPSPVPPRRYSGQRQREFEVRWLAVRAEAGEQPSDSAVPAVGYVSNGRYYKARWRQPPDATVANNLKPE